MFIKGIAGKTPTHHCTNPEFPVAPVDAAGISRLTVQNTIHENSQLSAIVGTSQMGPTPNRNTGCAGAIGRTHSRSATLITVRTDLEIGFVTRAKTQPEAAPRCGTGRTPFRQHRSAPFRFHPRFDR